MNDPSKLQAVYDDLIRQDVGRRFGPVGTTILAAGISAIPVAGGPMAYLIEKAGKRMFEPDMEKSMAVLAEHVLRLQPEIDKIADISALLDQVHALALEHESIRRPADEILQAVTILGDDPVILRSSNGAVQHLKNVSITDRGFLAEATSGARNLISNLRQDGGPAVFDSSGGAYQEIDGASFSRSSPRGSSQVDVGSARLESGAEVSFNTANAGIQITRSARADELPDYGIAIGDGPGTAGLRIGGSRSSPLRPAPAPSTPTVSYRVRLRTDPLTSFNDGLGRARKRSTDS